MAAGVKYLVSCWATLRVCATSNELADERVVQGERQDILKRLFREAKKAKISFSLDIAQAATALKHSRDRIIRALDILRRKTAAELKIEGVHNLIGV